MRFFTSLLRVINGLFTKSLPREAVNIDKFAQTMVHKLTELNANYAIIGGVALGLHGIVRATVDIDFLIDATAEAKMHDLMTRMGFETLYRTKEVSNYLLDNRYRVDFLHAHRRYSLRMLERSAATTFGEVTLKYLQAEDLIGLKLQALKNDPQRFQDQADIVSLLRKPGLDLNWVREYYTLFNKEAELDEFLVHERKR